MDASRGGLVLGVRMIAATRLAAMFVTFLLQIF